MTATFDELMTTQEAARHEIFLAGKQIGQTIKEALVDTSQQVQRRMAREIIRIYDNPKIGEVQHNMAQGMWYGYGLDEPISLLREELA